jgi:hypothetical protein
MCNPGTRALAAWRSEHRTSASGTEDPGSNPTRVKGFKGEHSNNAGVTLLNMRCLCV